MAENNLKEDINSHNENKNNTSTLTSGRVKPCIKNDKLNLTPYLDNTCKLVTTLKDAATISVSAEYGMGKTFFATCLEEKLKSDYKEIINPIYIDLFKNDYKDPLTVIMAEIIANINDENLKKILIEKATPVIQGLLPLASTVLSLAGINANAIADQINNYLNKKDEKDIASFKEELKQLCNGENSKKLVIMIDEVDRCNPNFAIQTLEVIKHFFDIDNIIFILFINPCYKQLLEQKFIATNQNITNNSPANSHDNNNYQDYGISSRGYIEKFINYNIYLKHIIKENNHALFTTLESCKNTEFIHDVFKQFNMEACLQFKNNDISKHINLLIYLFNQYFNNPISPRDIKRIIANVKLNIDTFYKSNYKSYNIVLLFLIYTLKIKFYSEYKKLVVEKYIILLDKFIINLSSIKQQDEYPLRTINIPTLGRIISSLKDVITENYEGENVEYFKSALYKENEKPSWISNDILEEWLFNVDFI